MSRELRDNIFGNVVGGLILTLIIAIYTPVRGWVVKVFGAAINSIFGSALTLPVWVVCLLAMGWFLFLIKERAVVKTKEPKVVGSSSISLEIERERQVAPQSLQLNELEMKIIQVLALVDGERLTVSQMSSRIQTNRLRVDQAIESLISKDLVRMSRNYAYGNSYSLSSQGRDFSIEHEFA